MSSGDMHVVVVTIVVLHVVGVEIVEQVCVGVGVGDHRFDTSLVH